MVRRHGRAAGPRPPKLPPIREPAEIVGHVTAGAAAETGLRKGTPVLVGGGGSPLALLGSGVCSPGMGSEVIGTSCIVTLIAKVPLLDPAICNVGTVEGGWGAFMLLDSGGDAVRWARRAFHDKALSYAEIVARAAEAPAGADGLFFMPYLTGERLGRHRNARAQFFGLAAGHGLAHLHRAVLEGVGFAVTRHVRLMESIAGQRLERIVASGGGARTDLWLKIKASAFGIPILVPKDRGMRPGRLRGAGGHRHRAVRLGSGGVFRLRGLRAGGPAGALMGRDLRPNAADVRNALRAQPSALRRSGRAFRAGRSQGRHDDVLESAAFP